TVIYLRKPGMTLSRIPMFTWFIIFTVIQMLFAFPALLGGLFMLMVDRLAGTLYFTAVQGGAMLWDNMFWFFGHPEVYIVLLPSFGAISEVIPTFTGRQLYGKTAILISTFAIVIPLSFLVWGHHMFATTLPVSEKEVFMVSTLAISVPFDIITIAFISSLAGGSNRLSTPFLFALGAIVVFIIGGITGVFLSSVPLDLYWRGTYFVVGHFHYVMVGASVFGLFAAMYYWFPKMTGRMYNEALGKLHFVTSFIFFNVLYFPFFFLSDMPRRIYTYNVASWALPNMVATVGAYLFGGVQIILVINFILSSMRGKPAPSNPWGSSTPEWSESPIYEPSMNGGMVAAASVSEGTSKPPVAYALGDISYKIGSPALVEPEAPIELETQHFSNRPIQLSAALSVAVLGLALSGYPEAIPVFALGIALVAWSILGFASDNLKNRFHMPDEKEGERWPFEGVSKIKLGIWTLLFSEVVLFGSILTAYMYVRLNSLHWPSGAVLGIPLNTEMTIILLSSSLTMFMALESIKKNNKTGLVGWLGVTYALGWTFIGLKFYDWYKLFSGGLTPYSSLFGSTYYFTTGIHAAHVIGGLGVMTYLIYKAAKGGYSSGDHSSIENFAIYWSFVDLVWVFIFALFFLI
ncbi:MAG: cbb3-type cytochrome c oxidase subunit I, partial [Thermoprotei archaeon]